MANILGDDKRQQILALGRLGWPLRVRHGGSITPGAGGRATPGFQPDALPSSGLERPTLARRRVSFSWHLNETPRLVETPHHGPSRGRLLQGPQVSRTPGPHPLGAGEEIML